MNLVDMPISRKLPILMVGLGLAGTVIVGLISFFTGRALVTDQVYSTLTGVIEGRASELGRYLDTLDRDVQLQAVNPTTISAIKEISQGYRGLGAGAPETLQRLYIDQNPNPAGKKEELDVAPDGSLYSIAHAKHHPWLRDLLRSRGYYDVFLFDAAGRIVYTVFKERDFATDAITGPWRDTGISRAFRAVSNGTASARIVHFEDFAPYEPSAGAPAAFVAAPVYESGTLLGAIAFQVPIDKLNDVMRWESGAGTSGDAFIVGGDRLMRTDSRVVKDSTILKTRVDGPAIVEALSGARGVMSTDIVAGGRSLVAFDHISFRGTNWALLAIQDEGEALAPVLTLALLIFSAAVILGIVLMISGTRIARSIAGPISKLTEAMTDLARQNLDATILGANRNDEIGDMARALTVFKEKMILARDLAKTNEDSRRLAADQAKQLEDARGAEQRSKLAEAEAREEKRLRDLKRAQDEAARKEAEAEGARRRSELMAQITTGFDLQARQLVAVLTKSSADMRASMKELAALAAESRRRAVDATNASGDASANVEAMASASTEMSASISEIDQRSDQANKFLAAVVGETRKAQRQMEALAVTTQNIGSVVGIIEQIASQITLLSLNATIEAARAGEAGRGFAVVANEVKALSLQAKQSTVEINRIVQSIRDQSNASIKALDTIFSQISEVESASSSIAAAVRQQSAAVLDIARNTSEASIQTRAAFEGTGTVAELTKKTDAVAEKSLDVLAMVDTGTAELGTSIDAFLVKARAVA